MGRLGIFAYCVFLAGSALAQTGSKDAPCVTASPACTEWVTLGGGALRSLVYRTDPIEMKNDGITRALIMVHGANRDADGYFRTALAAAFLAGALNDTVVIAHRFAAND